MPKLKVTSWNVEHFQRLFTGQPSTSKTKRRAAIAQEIREINSDILCILEGPKEVAHLKEFIQQNLGGDYAVVEAANGDYDINGDQWIWFLVRQ